MRLIFIGTGSAVPSVDRGFPSLALEFDDKWCWLFDVGEGTQSRIIADERIPVKFSKLDTIFITHLHGDHINGLFGLLATRAMQSSTRVLRVVGPRGIRQLVEYVLNVTGHWTPETVEAGTAPDLRGHVPDIHGNDGTSPSQYISWIELDYDVVDLEHSMPNRQHVIQGLSDTCVVTAVQIPHGPVPCFGYVIQEMPKRGRLMASKARELGATGPQLGLLATGSDVMLSDGTMIRSHDVTEEPRPGRVVAICGDTSDASSVDVLVHECTFADDISDSDNRGHSCPRIVAKMANLCNASALILNHFRIHEDEEKNKLMTGVQNVLELGRTHIMAFDGYIYDIPTPVKPQ